MRILQVSAEIFPLLKTGGLADVAGALPPALHAQGCDVRVLLPGFPAILQGLVNGVPVGQFTTPWDEVLLLSLGELPAIRCGEQPLLAYVLEAPALYDRPGSPYENAERRAYADNHRRFAALAFAAARIAHGMDVQWTPQLVHSHDWHAGLVPACISMDDGGQSSRVATVHTVHNLAYQGLFDASLFGDLGLPVSAFQVEGLEFHGQISFMKAGLFYADAITTVSPTYANEIQTPEQGCGLDGLLRARRDRLCGILNGVDDAVWNPASDPALPATFDLRRMAGKAKCKLALQLESGLNAQTEAPLFAIVSRLTEQKGLPLVLAVVQDIVASGGQLLILGSGDADLEQACLHQARAHAGQVAVRIGYDEAFAHRIFGGSDVTLVPSRFEPCGLTQMYGLRYGSLPLVRSVGGLADSVVDTDLATMHDETATGFSFHDFSSDALRHAVRRAFALYARKTAWAKVRQAGMRQTFSWDQAAAQYLAVYQASGINPATSFTSSVQPVVPHSPFLS
jgi:starch synthase